MRGIQRLFAVKSGELEVDSRERRAKCHACMNIWRLLRGSIPHREYLTLVKKMIKYIYSAVLERRDES